MSGIHLNPKWPNPGLVACREGRSFCGFVNDQTGVAAETVLTASSILMELQEGRRYFIVCFYMHLNTISDWCTVEWGVTPNADGSGVFTAKSPKFRVDTGNVQSGSSPSLTDFSAAPMTFTAADGRAFTGRVQGNDAGATFTVGYHGWYEELAT